MATKVLTPSLTPTIDTSALTPLEAHALAQVAKKAAKLRDRLDVGEGQSVDVVVRIKGAINVGGSSSATISQSPPAETVLAHVFECLGKPTRKKIRIAVSNCFAEYRGGGDVPESSKELLDEARDLLGAVNRARTIDRNGNVTGAIEDQVIERAGKPVLARAA